MDKIIIKGGRRLKGVVTISGSKNASLPIIAASLLANSNVTLENIPQLRDVTTMIKVITALGARVEIKRQVLNINPEGFKCKEAPYQLVRTMRASIYVMGPLLAKFGYAKVSLPGGCVIGVRPINLHLKGFEKLGAKVKIEHGYVEAYAKKLKGAEINLDCVSVGATANLMMAAVLAEGETIIRNAAKEPHIVDLGNFLKKMGAKIKGYGTDCISITGVRELSGCIHEIIPDYIEAGTFITCAAITKGNVILNKVPVSDLETVISKFKEAGVSIIEESPNSLRIKMSKNIKAIDINTSPHPGFPTDMQAQWMAVMSVANGTSVITESIWENRFMHVAELRRMGADITLDGNTAIIKGVKSLSSAQVMVSDLRAGAALVIAGLTAKGETEISRIYHLDRGYEKIEEKLVRLGADIKRIK